MKLGVIFTGGTIGCQVAEDGYLQLPDSSTYFLLEGAKKRGILDEITVIPSEPFRLFSEQITGETLSLLVTDGFCCMVRIPWRIPLLFWGMRWGQIVRRWYW